MINANMKFRWLWIYLLTIAIVWVVSTIHILTGPQSLTFGESNIRLVPRNITEAIIQIDAEVTKEMKEKLLYFNGESAPIGLFDPSDGIDLYLDASSYGSYGHFGIGMSIRNLWGLWDDSRLRRWFLWRSVRHPDIMSGIIMREYVDYHRGEPVSNRYLNRIVVLLILAGIGTLLLYFSFVVIRFLVRIWKRRGIFASGNQ